MVNNIKTIKSIIIAIDTTEAPFIPATLIRL